MARRIANIFPLDTKSSTSIGLSLPFSGAGDAVFKLNYTTKDQIKSNLINLLLTNPGERVLNPDYGAGVREFVFDQLNDNTYDVLKSRIQDLISANFRNISINEIEVLGNDNSQTLNVNITYNIINFGVEDEINLIFE